MHARKKSESMPPDEYGYQPYLRVPDSQRKFIDLVISKEAFQIDCEFT